jgi:uncharacterized protein YbjT (DUF2867 family)
MILVTGGTGHVGVHVVHDLQARGEAFRVFTRSPARARDLLGDVELAEGDFAVPATFDAALRGADRLFLLTPGAPDQVAVEGALTSAAVRAGVRHVVKQSVLGAALDAPALLVRWHAEAEALIRSSGLAFTFLQPALFMQMATALQAPGGEITSTVGDARLGFVDVRDIAAVAVQALTTPGHAGHSYRLTGPQALSWREAADVLTRSGRPSHYVPVTEAQAREAMGSRLPAWRVEPTLELNRAIRDGLYDLVTGDVERVTGRPPRSFEEFARELRAAA